MPVLRDLEGNIQERFDGVTKEIRVDVGTALEEGIYG